MSVLQVMTPDTLPEASASPGISRHMAFKADDSVVLRSQSEPGVVSGWHTHGEYHVYGYLVSGVCRLEANSTTNEAVELKPGDFFHVPPNTLHREINPSPDVKNDIILFLRGSGQMVYNQDEMNKHN
jgi:quercetin dioxygenase-like cupin family protein